MTDEENNDLWVDVPSLLEDPFGWVAGWWRRIDNVASIVGFGAFLVVGVVGTWRFATRRLVTNDLFVFAGVVVMGLLMAIRGVLKKWRHRRGVEKPAAALAGQPRGGAGSEGREGHRGR